MAILTTADLQSALWLDGADSSTLFDAVSGGSLVAPAGTVARWEDKSGNARHVVQSNSGLRPTRESSIQNGLSVLRFTSDVLSIGASDIWRNISGGLILVVKKATNRDHSYLVDIRTNAGSAVRALVESGSPTNKASAGGRRSDANSFARISSSADVSITNFELYCAEFDYANADLRQFINGTKDGESLSFQTAGLTDNTTSASVSIGAFSIGIIAFQGDIAEVVIAHTISDRLEHEGILAWKWGLQSFLPNDHPYKNVAPRTGGIIPILRQHYAAQGAR